MKAVRFQRAGDLWIERLPVVVIAPDDGPPFALGVGFGMRIIDQPWLDVTHDAMAVPANSACGKTIVRSRRLTRLPAGL